MEGTEELFGELTGHEHAVTCMAMRGETLFSGSEDRTVRVWDTEKASSEGALLETLDGHESTVVGVWAMSSTGHLISVSTHDPTITGERQGKLILWDVQESEVIEGALSDEVKADLEEKIGRLKEGLESEKDEEKKVKIHEVLTGFETQLEESSKGEVSMQRLILDTFTHPEKFRSVTRGRITRCCWAPRSAASWRLARCQRTYGRSRGSRLDKATARRRLHCRMTKTRRTKRMKLEASTTTGTSTHSSRQWEADSRL